MALEQLHEVVKIPFTLDGSGSGIENDLLQRPPYAGIIHSIVVRLDTGGLATAVDLWVVDRVNDLASVTAQPPAEQVVVDVSSLTLTASGTDASLRTTFDHPIGFFGGLGVIANVTATGAYTIEGVLEVRSVYVPSTASRRR